MKLGGEGFTYDPSKHETLDLGDFKNPRQQVEGQAENQFGTLLCCFFPIFYLFERTFLLATGSEPVMMKVIRASIELKMISENGS